mmetsp:Transcript_36365/g.104785  ORF Transcript_36365/g.104785 Transcript_36365/m.104785 type:complete len:216 (-) Transcript_36365:597-1244(-)
MVISFEGSSSSFAFSGPSAVPKIFSLGLSNSGCLSYQSRNQRFTQLLYGLEVRSRRSCSCCCLMKAFQSWLCIKTWPQPTTHKLVRARVKATFIRLMSRTKPMLLLSASARTTLTMIASFSRPWNPSTVFTSTGHGAFICNPYSCLKYVRISFTCSLYGEMTAKRCLHDSFGYNNSRIMYNRMINMASSSLTKDCELLLCWPFKLKKTMGPKHGM